MTDEIKQPAHYYLEVMATVDGERRPVTVECIDLIDAKRFGDSYRMGNVEKYLFRAGKKDGQSRSKDLRKAVRYLEMELKREEHLKSFKIPKKELSYFTGNPAPLPNHKPGDGCLKLVDHEKCPFVIFEGEAVFLKSFRDDGEAIFFEVDTDSKTLLDRLIKDAGNKLFYDGKILTWDSRRSCVYCFTPPLSQANLRNVDANIETTDKHTPPNVNKPGDGCLRLVFSGDETSVEFDGCAVSIEEYDIYDDKVCLKPSTRWRAFFDYLLDATDLLYTNHNVYVLDGQLNGLYFFTPQKGKSHHDIRDQAGL